MPSEPSIDGIPKRPKPREMWRCEACLAQWDVDPRLWGAHEDERREDWICDGEIVHWVEVQSE